MFHKPINLLTLIVAASAFGLVVCLWAGAVLIWFRKRQSHVRKIEQRIGLLDGAVTDGKVLRLWHDGQEATTVVPDRAPRNMRGRIDSLLHDAGWKMPANRFVVILALIAVGSFTTIYLLSGRFLAGFGGASGALMIFWALFNRRVAKRSALFERQLLDALELAARSLRVGHPLIGAFQIIAEEFTSPIGPIFASVCQQQSLGVSLSDAVKNVADEHQSEDLHLFATAVVIQIRSGGSLADMMERLATVIRDRMRLARRVRVLTAQTQMSKRILQAMPLLVFVILNVVNPDYMRPLYTTDSGRGLMAFAGICIIVGSWLMNRLAVLRY